MPTGGCCGTGSWPPHRAAGWADAVVTRTGTWSASDARRITGLSNVADIPVGALVTAGQGVGREVYVTSKDVAGGRVTLSAPFYGAPVTQTYTFRRFKYLLDFSGWLNLQRFVVSDIEFLCAGTCSGINLPRDGLVFQIQDCFFTGPKDRGITSTGEGCQGMQIDRCQFLSNEQDLNAPQRKSIAFNTNSSDIKVRDNRVNKFRHFGVVGGTGNIFSGNHFFQGDGVTDGPRTAGLILTDNNTKTTFEGNYVDNCYVEWTNERDPTPAFTGGFSFHGLSLDGNIFFSTESAPWMNFITIKPYGRGAFHQRADGDRQPVQEDRGRAARRGRGGGQLFRGAGSEPDGGSGLRGQYLYRHREADREPGDAAPYRGECEQCLERGFHALHALWRAGALGHIVPGRRTAAQCVRT
ncbi:MAG: right-handed parallel beta-helix repeat-containing protein [Roseicyclus sp.]|uniref:right-handed parallel beta-helix repeat-containing protein n=1 Tax=Roseicyclus sp. TaxID=1914329 RepID=UPI003A8609E4